MGNLISIKEWLAESSEHPLWQWIFCAAVLVVFFLLSRWYKKKSVTFFTKLIKKMRGTYWEDLLRVLTKQITILIWAAGLCIALWNMPLADGIMGPLQTFIKKIMQLLCLCLLGWACCCAVDTVPVFKFKFLGTAEAVRRMLNKAIKVLIIIFVALAVLEAFGLPVASLVTGLGIGGLVISLAAQDTASNLIAGLVILIEHPFAIGDWIVTSQAEGTVEDITFRSTKIRTLENTLAIVPNSVVGAEMVTNGSERKKRMAEFTVGVCYDTSREKIEKVSCAFRELLKNDDEIEDEPIVVRLSGFGASSIDILVRYYTKTTDPLEFLKVTEKINLEIITIMEENGVEFAFPSTTVYMAGSEEK